MQFGSRSAMDVDHGNIMNVSTFMQQVYIMLWLRRNTTTVYTARWFAQRKAPGAGTWIDHYLSNFAHVNEMLLPGNQPNVKNVASKLMLRCPVKLGQ